MFSCTAPSNSLEFFNSCRQGSYKFKKIGNYIYNYDSLIGAGTYSTVYEGTNLENDKEIAIKVIDLEMIKQKNLFNLLYQEMELLSQLSHPNIIKCYAIIKSQNRCYIVTELCKKENLENIIEKSKNKRLSSSEKQKIIYDIYQGLQYLAQKAIIHRDIKTANILFSQSGRAKIADFGFATYGLNEFKDNAFIGTPLYMSPEAILEQKYSSKTDIWSFGVIIYELFMGEAPLSKCKNEKQLLVKIVQSVEIPKNQLISEDLKQLIEGCLQPNSMKRWNIDKLSRCAYIENLKKKFNNQSSELESVQGSIKQYTKQSTATRVTKGQQSISIVNDLRLSLKNQNLVIQDKDKNKVQPTQTVNQLTNIKRFMSLQLESQHQHSQPANFHVGTLAHIYKSQWKVPNNAPNGEFNFKSMSTNHPPQPKFVAYNPTNLPQPVNKINVNTLSQNRFQRQHSLNQSITNVFPSKTIHFNDKLSIKKMYSNDQKQLQRKSQIPLRHAHNSLMPQSFSLVRNKDISYKQAISLIHYCRLLHKILLYPRYYNRYLKQWQLFLIDDLRQNIKYISMKQSHALSLKTVLEGYYNQYTEKEQDRRYSMEYNHDFVPQIKSIIKILQSMIEKDHREQEKGLQKELVSCILQDTQLLQECLTENPNSFSTFSKKSKSELYLDWYNNIDIKKNQQSHAKVLPK